jgi:hypothetical protein
MPPVAVDDGRLARALFVDFSEAFDRADYSAMVNKLAAFTWVSAHRSTSAWVHSCLHGWQQCLKVKSTSAFSKWTSINGDAPQSTRLSPYILSIHINDE